MVRDESPQPACRAGRGGAGVEEALDQLRAGGTVFSRHRLVLNLAARGGRLLALQAPCIPLTPFGLVVEPPPPTWPAEGTLVRRAGDTLLVGDLAIDLSSRREVASSLPSADLSPARMAALADLLRVFAERGAFGAWWTDEAPVSDPVRAALRKRARRGIQALTYALRAPSSVAEAVLGAAPALMGLGPGGTPSGDDVLEGAVSAWLVVGPDRPAAQRVAAALAARAPEVTTRLAAEFYYHLARGRVSEQLHTLLALLDAGDDDSIARAATDLGRFGETSGWDTVAGVHAYLLARGSRD